MKCGWESNYKSMSYAQLSKEGEKLKDNWFSNFDRLFVIYTQMRLKS